MLTSSSQFEIFCLRNLLLNWFSFELFRFAMAQQSSEMTQQREQESNAEGLASGVRGQRQQRNPWIVVLHKAHRGFKAILPNAIENFVAWRTLRWKKTMTILFNLATSFFTATEASKEIVYPNLQKCLSLFEASGDREHLKEWLPDTKKMKLWVVSDSVLTLYNYKGDPQRHVSQT